MQLRNGTVVGANQLPVQARPLFEEGVKLVFSKWTALALAVENQWGGANSVEKADILYRDCLDWFYKNRGASGACTRVAATLAAISLRRPCCHPAPERAALLRPISLCSDR